MKTLAFSLRSALIAAAVLLPLALIACGGPALTGYLIMDSYDQLQQEYSKWHESAIYPDIPDMNFDKSTLDYKVFYSEQVFEAETADKVELSSYSIDAYGEVDGFRLYCIISCGKFSGDVPPPDTCREEFESEETLRYKDVDIVFRSSEYSHTDKENVENGNDIRDYSDRFAVVANGNLYCISTTVMNNNAESSENRDKTREKLNAIMYSCICSIIDAEQNNI